MKLRTQLSLAFFFFAVVPLAGIVTYSYFTSLAAFRRGVEAETQALAGQLGDRMSTVRSDMEQLVEELGELPVPLLLNPASAAGRRGRGDVYSRLVEGIGEAAALVEWFEFRPRRYRAEGGADRSEGVIIFPSEALANALRKLERYRDLDVASARAVRESVEMIVEQAVKPRRRLDPNEAAALDASAERSLRLLGTEFRSEVKVGERTVGDLLIQVRPLPMLRRVLSRTRRDEGEIPYALDSEGGLYVADPRDKELLAELPISGVELSQPTLAQQGAPGWIVVEDRDSETGVVFGIARPIRESLAGMQQTAVRNFVAGLGIAGLALLGILFLSGRLTRNLGVLTAGAERLAAGDRIVRVPEGANDELGQLARTFNRLALQLSQQEQQLVEEVRRRKEQELQQRLLEAENQRKSQELEDARRFQLSLLPKVLPQLPGYDIGAQMRTATEVGGDYYDFFKSPSGTMVAALGDATGHGSRAGIMTTVVKGMLSLGAGEDLPAFLKRANAAICGMKLDRMSMSLLLARIEGERICLAAAGMPPALLFRAGEGKIEEITLEGAPLGGLAQFDYPQWDSHLGPGDTLLLMSDGFPELLDDAERQLGYARAAAAFEQVAGESPRDIIAGLSEAAAEWNGGQPPNDDMTFVVFKSDGHAVTARA